MFQPLASNFDIPQGEGDIFFAPPNNNYLWKNLKIKNFGWA